MKKLFKIFLSLFACIFLYGNSNAQNFKPSDYNSWSMGLHFGMLKYYGDIRQIKYSPEDKFRKANTGFSIDLAKSFNPVFGARAAVLLGGLSGSNKDMNLYFKNTFKELDITAFVNLNNLIGYYPRNAKVLNFYVFIGGGAMIYNANLKSIDEDSYINSWGYDSIGNKTTAKKTFTMPLGIGVKFKADERFDIGLETQLHLANTDNMDAYEGNSLYNDRYGYTNITLTYKFGTSIKEFVDWSKPGIDTSIFNYATTTTITDTVKSNNTKTSNNISNNQTTTNNNSVSNQNTNTTQNNSNNNTSNNNSVSNSNNNTTVNNNQSTSNTTTEKVVAVDKKYFIISGNYKTKKLAKENVEKYIKKGFPETMILGQTSSGNWRVCIKSFEKQDEAALEYVAIKKSNAYAKLLLKKSEKDYTDITSKVNSIINMIPKKDTVNTTKTVSNQTVVTNNTSNNNTTTSNNNTTTTNNNTTIKNNTTSTNNTSNNNTTTNNTNTNNTNTNNNTTTTNNTNNTISTNNNTSTNNSTTNNSNTTNNTTTQVENPVKVVKNFFIISGSFSNLADANAGVAALKAKGYPDAEVVGKNDAGSYRICFKAYATREEANKDLPQIKAKSNPSAWIFEKK